MNYTNEQIGRALQDELERGYDILRITRWAFSTFYNKIGEFTFDQKNILLTISIMEVDPQFEFSEDELSLIAEMLINNIDDPIKKINEMNK